MLLLGTADTGRVTMDIDGQVCTITVDNTTRIANAALDELTRFRGAVS